jgi:hypothetical protein
VVLSKCRNNNDARFSIRPQGLVKALSVDDVVRFRTISLQNRTLDREHRQDEDGFLGHLKLKGQNFVRHSMKQRGLTMRWLFKFLFTSAGWKITGGFPPALKKFIVAVGPHTSNWDFVVGIAARSILKMKNTKFLGKSQLFLPPYGWIFRAIGGYPVERSSRHDMVNQVANLFHAHNHFILAITPEGTRKKVEKLRTGFYYIAKAAHVPIIPVGFDFKKKEVIVGAPLHPGEDITEDFQRLYDFYGKINAKNPELSVGTGNKADH